MGYEEPPQPESTAEGATNAPATNSPDSSDFIRKLSFEKKRLCGSIAELEAVALELGFDTAALDEQKRRLDDMTIRVVVIGEVNRGKSTFMNALVGSMLFPRRATLCTAALTELRDGAARYKAYYRDGSSTEARLPLEGAADVLWELVSRENPDADQLERVEVWFPNPFAREGLVLIDTPGVNDPEDWRERLTLHALNSADAAILLLDAHKPLTRSERNFLQANVLGALINRVLFVVNKADEMSDEERTASRGRCDLELSKIVDEPSIFLVSALNGLKSKLGLEADAQETTRFEAFRGHLEAFLWSERIDLALGSTKRRLLRLADGYTEAILHRHQALAVERDELFSRVQAAERNLDKIERASHRALDKAKQEARMIPQNVETTALNSWNGAKADLLFSDAAIHSILSAGRESQQVAAKALQDRLAQARRKTLVSVENSLRSVSAAHSSSLAKAMVSLDADLQAVARNVDGGIPVVGASRPISALAFEIAGELQEESERSESLLGKVGHLTGTVIAITLGLAATIVERLQKYLNPRDERTEVVRTLQKFSRKERDALVKGARQHAQQVVTAHLRLVERENMRKLEHERKNLASIKRAVQGDQEAVQERRRHWLALHSRVEETKGSII